MSDGHAGQLGEADRETLADTSRRYRAALKRYFKRRRLSETEADDAVQDVFARLARKEGLARLDNLEGYIFQTAASVATDLYRRGRSREAERHLPYEETLHAPSELSPEEVYQGRAELALMVQALQELPERTRHAFVLARLEGLGHAEIARRLGVSVSAVEKQVIKATAHLALRVGRR